MKLFSTLSQLKKIQPNPEYTRVSRLDLVSRAQTIHPRANLRSAIATFLLSNFEAGGAIVLSGLAIFLFFGGFSFLGSALPLGLSSFDRSALKAEAEAIDIQIKLADVSYMEQQQQVQAQSVAQAQPATAKKEVAAKAKSATANKSEGEVSSSTEQSSTTVELVTLDEALAQLSQ